VKGAFAKLPPERREAILDKAIELFAEKGFDGSSVADFCARAGISNGAMYKYFKNKDDLFLAVAERGALIIESLYRDLDERLTHREYFRSLFERVRALSASHRCAVSLYIEIGSPALNRFADALSSGIEEVGFRHVRESLERARDRGEIDRDLDVEAAVFAIDNLIVLYGYSQVSEYHRRRISSFLWSGARASDEAGEENRIEFLLEAIETILSSKGGAS
jgi:TetR/AcrR family transcriptional regulator